MARAGPGGGTRGAPRPGPPRDGPRSGAITIEITIEWKPAGPGARRVGETKHGDIRKKRTSEASSEGGAYGEEWKVNGKNVIEPLLQRYLGSDIPSTASIAAEWVDRRKDSEEANKETTKHQNGGQR